MVNKAAAKLLEGCEKGLREFVSKAAASGDYASVIQLTSWAKAIAHLVEDARTDLQSAEPGAKRRRIEVASSSAGESSGSRRGVRRKLAKPKHPKPAGYPKFYRHEEELVKIGWSRRGGEEYIHKAPHSALAQLASKLAVVGAGGRMFSAENILPLTSPSDGSQIPNYQAYLCLAWLRQEGLIEQHGRQGYTVANGENLASAVNARWQALERWRGVMAA